MSVLSSSEIERIETKAEDILQSVYGNVDEIELPIDLKRVLDKYNIQLKQGEFTKDPEISGIYDREEGAIYVAKDDVPQRKSFTVAHELGHYFLHQDKSSEIFYRRQVTQIDEETIYDEAQANWFAASLLMPKDLVIKYWRLTKDKDEIAAIFGTSPIAVYYRLKNLGLIT